MVIMLMQNKTKGGDILNIIRKPFPKEHKDLYFVVENDTIYINADYVEDLSNINIYPVH